MRGAKPFVFIPVSMALFAAGIAATWPLSTIQFWIWSGMAAAASAAILAIILAPGGRPDIDLKQAVEIVVGSARWQGPGRTVPFGRLADVVEGLSKSAAGGQVTIWGRRVEETEIRGLQAAETKIPPEYWLHHRIDVAAFAANQRGATESFMVGRRAPLSAATYNQLRFDQAEVRKFQRQWQKKR